MICFDASVAAKWILPEPHSALADALLAVTLAAGRSIIAPPLLPFEVANILRQRMNRQALPLSRAQQLLADFLAVPI